MDQSEVIKEEKLILNEYKSPGGHLMGNNLGYKY